MPAKRTSTSVPARRIGERRPPGVVAVRPTVMSDSAATCVEQLATRELGVVEEATSSTAGLRRVVERADQASSMRVSPGRGGGGLQVGRAAAVELAPQQEPTGRASDLADEVERRRQGALALFPLGRADLTGVLGARTGRP